MSPSQLKLLLSIAALAAAFGSGWAVNGWRLDAQHLDAQKKLTKELTERIQEQATEFQNSADRARLRETELLRRLNAARHDAEVLREEIENVPVVTLTERVEVPADCPAVPQCATVDSLQYRERYNRAFTGTLPDPGAGD